MLADLAWPAVGFQFILKVFSGVEVRALCRPVKFFHTDLNKPFLYGPCLSCYSVPLRFPFTGTKELALTMKNSPRPLFLLHQTLQLALYIRGYTSDLSIGLPNGKV